MPSANRHSSQQGNRGLSTDNAPGDGNSVKTMKPPRPLHRDPIVVATALFIICLPFALGCGSREADRQPLEPPASVEPVVGPDALPDVESRNEDGMTALHRMAIDGEVQQVRKLLDAGADIGARSNEGNTPLHGAAYQGNEETVLLLLDAGADVNAANRHGETVLHIAVYGEQTGIVRVLLQAGARVNAETNDGDTPSDWAEDESIKKLLLEFTVKEDGK
jgi:ankyrin repeat protein